GVSRVGSRRWAEGGGEGGGSRRLLGGGQGYGDVAVRRALDVDVGGGAVGAVVVAVLAGSVVDRAPVEDEGVGDAGLDPPAAHDVRRAPDVVPGAPCELSDTPRLFVDEGDHVDHVGDDATQASRLVGEEVGGLVGQL